MRRLLLTTACLLAWGAPAAQAATSNVVRGAGLGHGIGMSQYGAYGFAQQGLGYRQILRHYYRGAQIGIAPSRPIRVLLQASDPFVRVRGATRIGGRPVSPGRTYVVRPSGGGLRVAGVGRFSDTVKVTGGRSTRLMGPAINGVTSGLYRGTMVLRPGLFGGVTAVNHVPLDSYLQGVVAEEMPTYWDSDALRAQAVTARTYALATRQRGEVFDLYPDTRSQVYDGVGGETSRTNAVVRDTAREVLTYDGRPIITYYFSTSGGRTENVELSFPGAAPAPYLKSVRDPYDDISPLHRWRFRFSNARMGALLGTPGAFRRVEVLRRGRSPRIVRARVYGSRGSRVLTGLQIKARLGLHDSWAYFTRVSTSQVRYGARPAAARPAFPEIAGAFAPAPRSKRLLVERREGGAWERVGVVRTGRGGRYRTTVAVPGAYRVRSGSVAGPSARVR